MGGRRTPPPRFRRADCIRDRAQDRRLGHLARLRERSFRARRHSRRRRAGRGRDPESAHDPLYPAGAAPGLRRRGAAAAGGARRDLPSARGLPALERATRGRGKKALAQPSQRRRRLAAPARSAHYRLSPAGDLGLRRRRRRRARARDALAGARLASRARLSRQPGCRAARVDRVGDTRLRGVGAAASRARLRDRWARRQARFLRSAGDSRIAAPASALGARLQMGADDGPNRVARNSRSRRAHRCAQPLGRAGAGGGGRRHGLQGHAAQRGRH